MNYWIEEKLMSLKDNDIFLRFYSFCAVSAVIVIMLMLLSSMSRKPEPENVLSTPVIETTSNLTCNKITELEYYTHEMRSKQNAVFAIKYSRDNEIETSLLVAVMRAESYFDPDAVNYNATSVDRGLCQLNSLTFHFLTENEAFDPETNIKIGAAFLKWCLTENQGNIVKALAYYNAGSGNVSRKRIGANVLDYINRVLVAKARYEKELLNVSL